ncbi:MAG: ExbD/TolR family protein [Acidobacteriota bacterium]|nr:ExbD/TolR family protein [Acidobacteriota bacterium]
MPKLQESASGGRRGRRGPRASTSLSEINVVPLVDVMLVLLIIFMVTAPMMQQGFAVNLPQSTQSQPLETAPLYVTVPADVGTTGRVRFGDKAEEIGLAVLGERVRQELEGRAQKDVFIRGDGAVTLQQLFSVFDLLNKAGVQRVGMVSQPASR